MKGHLDALYLYPIKSCAGIKVTCAELTPFGIKGDRQWMIVNEEGKMVTQRTTPKLALICPIFVNKTLWLQYPGVKSIPLSVSNSEKVRSVKIWKDTVIAELACEEVNSWLTTVLNSAEPLTMVHFDQQKIRMPGNITRFGKTGRHFADAAPLLITHSESLVSVNNLLLSQNKPSVDMRSFRPNIVVSGLDAFSEHKIAGLGINGVTLTYIDHCERCSVITIDPDTAIKHENMIPYRELATLNCMPNNLNSAAFGVNAILAPTSQNTTICVNDTLEFYSR